MFLNALAEK